MVCWAGDLRWSVRVEVVRFGLKIDSCVVVQGGTELAFMSTTKDLGVAIRYSLCAHSLIFKVSMY